MINNKTAKIISNFSFIAPAFVALFRGNFLHLVLILLVLTFSSIYHSYKEKKFYVLDLICALGLISYNVYYLIYSGVSVYIWTLVTILVLISFYYKYIKVGDNYQWHILSALITLFVVSV